jgi:hypothetical protein
VSVTRNNSGSIHIDYLNLFSMSIDRLCSFRRIFSITCAHNKGIDRKFPEVVAFHA